LSVYSKKTRNGKRWYFQRMIDGEYHRGGGYLTKREAQEAERFLCPNRKMAFGELCDKYISWIRSRNQSAAWVYEKILFVKKHLSPWFTKPVDDISRGHIEEHLLRRAQAVSTATANKDLKFIKAIFSFGVQMGYCSGNPASAIARMPTEERLKYVPPLDDFMKVYMVARPVEKRLLALLFCTAARVGEILNLRWEDVADSYLILRSRKHKEGRLRERKIPLNPVMKEAFDFLSTHVSCGRKEGFVFQNPRGEGNRYLRRPKLMRSLCEKAGVRSFGFHSIRHLATSCLMREGESIQTLKDYLGHAKITTTQIYVHSLEDSLSVAAQKLGNLFNKYSIKSSKNSINVDKNAKNVQNCTSKKVV